jgi:ribosomal protein L19
MMRIIVDKVEGIIVSATKVVSGASFASKPKMRQHSAAALSCFAAGNHVRIPHTLRKETSSKRVTAFDGLILHLFLHRLTEILSSENL